MSSEQQTAGSVRLYHPCGVSVTLPVGVPCDYARAFADVARALAAGFLTAAPGLEAGEERDEIGYVLRCQKVNKSGRMSSRVHLYSTNSAVEFKVLSEWLDSDDEDHAFEQASGLRLATMKAFPAAAAPKRGESSASDEFIYKAPKPFYAVHIANPDYDEKEAEAFAARKETYKVSKRLFVRWEPAAGSKPATPPAASSSPASPQTAGGQQQSAGASREPQTASELASEYRFTVDDEGFERLERIREKLWAKFGDDEKRIAKGASTECRQRLADSVQEEATGGRW